MAGFRSIAKICIKRAKRKSVRNIRQINWSYVEIDLREKIEKNQRIAKEKQYAETTGQSDILHMQELRMQYIFM
jgi:hypothetical protein